MISELLLKFGRSPSTQAEPIKATPMTIFVGPNNSGKSLALSEISSFCKEADQNPNKYKIIKNIIFTGVSDSYLKKYFSGYNDDTKISLNFHGEYISSESTFKVFKEALIFPQSNLKVFRINFLSKQILNLTGNNRLSLINQQAMGDLLAKPTTSMQIFFQNDNKRLELRKIIYEAFKLYFAIDPTNGGQLNVCLSKVQPDSNELERGLHKKAIEFFKAAERVSNFSDGVKAFIGILMEAMAGDPRVLIIDEPEAFLHPALAAKLGYALSRTTQATEKSTFVSTHSASFIMGCIQSGIAINIIRLTYYSGIATARVLESDKILHLMRHPLLRSTGVLNGLFYDFVVVTESDADRAFYQEINERLLRFKPEWGVSNCLFLNAQNKQTVRTIIKPLRELGIPTVGIVDIDILKNGGKEWSDFLGSATVPTITIESLATTRAKLDTIIKSKAAQKIDIKRCGGIDIFDSSEKQAAQNLLKQLEDYGLFIVPNGELESWLKPLQATGHGPSWLIEIFEKMGEDPQTPNYLKPSNNDVWEFIYRIKQWCINPNRKGIPD